jgi:hypothetical protein
MDLGATATVEQKAAAARYQRLQQMAVDKKCTGVPVMKPDTAATTNSGGANATNSSPSPEGVQSPAQNLAIQSEVTSNGANLPNPAKRLEELNELYKKGLITQKEYDSKKADILKSL